MNNSAAKVGEIFTEAGASFNRLADMTTMLHQSLDQCPGVQVKNVKRKVSETVSNSHQVHNNPTQQVTLNMLNAPVLETEVETTEAVKLEYVADTDDITSGIRL